MQLGGSKAAVSTVDVGADPINSNDLPAVWQPHIPAPSFVDQLIETEEAGKRHGDQIRLYKVPEGDPLPLLPDVGAQRRDEVRTPPAVRGDDQIWLTRGDADGFARRAFLTKSYPTMKKHNPSIPIMLREAQGTLPRVYARYELGREESKSLEGTHACTPGSEGQEGIETAPWDERRVRGERATFWLTAVCLGMGRSLGQADRGCGDRLGTTKGMTGARRMAYVSNIGSDAGEKRARGPI